jgi:hypothetical protein
MPGTKKLWWGILILILISPLGLILPEVFKSGPAWGEWGADEIGKMVGFIPEGFKKITDLWRAPVPDYNLSSWEGKGLARSSLGYIVSGGIGVGVIVLVTFLLGKFLGKKGDPS